MVCDPSTTLGQQLRAFAQGSRRRLLPELFRFCCRVFFVPVGERLAEAGHRDVKVTNIFRHAGPLSVAMSLRLPEVERLIEEGPESHVLELIALVEKT
eukprot:14166898-Alexandrium_andersonii.AAC.1